jgi:hypothetical protein
MFPTGPKSKLAQRALGVARVARSFLLLEDDYDVDWDVGQDEHGQASHPHRAPLRSWQTRTRAGQPAAPAHVCLSPVAHAAHAPHRARARRLEAEWTCARELSDSAGDSRTALERQP